MKHRIDSGFFVHGHLPAFDQMQVKNEPMLFNCDLEGARALGGPITQAFLNALPINWTTVPLVIDSRVHMLMPGWHPCIPGWHHDDVPRTREDGQPNYAEGQTRSRHMIALVNGDICPTEFAVGTSWFQEPAPGRTIYADWHDEVERQIADQDLWRVKAASNLLIEFNDRTWHRGTAAVGNGWRFFIRASRYQSPEGAPVARGNPRTNEVRRQVQVYMPELNAGW